LKCSECSGKKVNLVYSDYGEEDAVLASHFNSSSRGKEILATRRALGDSFSGMKVSFFVKIPPRDTSE